LAHKLAVANEHVTADVVEASEFPEMAQKYQIYGVPKIVINDVASFEGALPEAFFIQQVVDALESSGNEQQDDM